MTDTTRQMREWHVQQVNANMSISGKPPDTFTRTLQQRYIDGEIAAEDMAGYTMEAFKNGEGFSADDPPIERQEPFKPDFDDSHADTSKA